MINKNICPKDLAKIGIVLVVLIIIVIALFNFLTQKSNIEYQKNDEQNPSTSQIQVHVAGEVNKPGVYKLDVDSRIIDAINAAGGFTNNADQSSLNLAKNAEDGEQILIKSTINTTTDQNSDNAGAQNNGKVNINTADLTQLQSLSGVGPATAQKIIDYRNANGKFKSIEEIKNVSGIGEKTYAKFSNMICV